MVFFNQWEPAYICTVHLNICVMLVHVQATSLCRMVPLGANRGRQGGDRHNNSTHNSWHSNALQTISCSDLSFSPTSAPREGKQQELTTTGQRMERENYVTSADFKSSQRLATSHLLCGHFAALICHTGRLWFRLNIVTLCRTWLAFSPRASASVWSGSRGSFRLFDMNTWESLAQSTIFNQLV